MVMSGIKKLFSLHSCNVTLLALVGVMQKYLANGFVYTFPWLTLTNRIVPTETLIILFYYDCPI